MNADEQDAATRTAARPPRMTPDSHRAASLADARTGGANVGHETASSGRTDRILLRLCALVLLGLFTFHFAATTLYLTPPNPIRIALHRPVERYMRPYFSQSWRLFAPEPGGTDGTVFVECRPVAGEPAGDSGFFDITTPLHEHRYHHRFSPGLLLARAQKPRLFVLANPMHEAIRRHGLPSAVIEEARAELHAAAKRRFEAGKAHLYRIASAACDRRLGVGRTMLVRARYLSRKIPPFGARDSAPAREQERVYEFPWAPYEAVDGY